MTVARTILFFLMYIAAATAALDAQTSVFVPGNASGSFGNPLTWGGSLPLVPAVTVTGPATITVTYMSGNVTDSWGTLSIGPKGIKWNPTGAQTPLQEQAGVSGGTIDNLDALIGAFVSETAVSASGFHAIDGTKNITTVGIRPGLLFFIGNGRTFKVELPGTLFLGINDYVVIDNAGGFNVEVTVDSLAHEPDGDTAQQ